MHLESKHSQVGSCTVSWRIAAGPQGLRCELTLDQILGHCFVTMGRAHKRSPWALPLSRAVAHFGFPGGQKRRRNLQESCSLLPV